ncbi:MULTISPECIES: hypothetical protein [unclassified Brachybacterium]|uniref:hypothetical protein n=1 Tax=unclassified Brachybacterium TaxID=2623841 RepID=UPI003607B907
MKTPSGRNPAETGPSDQVVYVVRGDHDDTRESVESFFREHGWSPRERGPGRVDYERGSRRRTILLGALAGRRFFLTAQIEIRERDHTTDVRYRWGAGAGLALGGTVGRDRAARAHRETAAALEKHLEADGRLVSTREI